MKVRNSLKSLAKRHRDNKLIRRKGRVYIINKTNPRFKARQGQHSCVFGFLNRARVTWRGLFV